MFDQEEHTNINKRVEKIPELEVTYLLPCISPLLFFWNSSNDHLKEVLVGNCPPAPVHRYI